MPDRLEQYDSFPIAIRDIYVELGFNCRLDFTPQSVTDLAASVKESGGYPTGLRDPILIQPITDAANDPRSNPDYAHVKWRLIAGHRRLKACDIFLKWEMIPCRIISGLTEEEAQILNFSENFERKDLNILEEALWIARVFPDVPAAVIGRRIKKHTGWVVGRQQLIELPLCCQTAASEGKLSLKDIDIIWHLEPERREQKAIQYIRTKTQEGRAPIVSKRQIQKKGPHPKSEITQMATELMERHGDHPIIWAVTAGLGWVTRNIEMEDLIRRIDSLVKTGTINEQDAGTTD
jgi:ParB-like chromosome segregation protein Spo0J